MANIVKTYSFTNGQPADGTQVNKNFDDIINGVGDTADLHPVLASVWPVGSVFTSVVSTNPATLMGFGTWAALAAGKVLIGLNSADADFNTVRKTGGAKTVQASAQAFTGSVVSSGTPTVAISITATGTASAVATEVHTHTVTAAGTNAAGAATSVVQPYFVVYFWEMTA